MTGRFVANSRPVLSRIFLVGCSRSGTTVIQRALTERYRLFSLPETDFFGLAVGGGLGALACHLGFSRPASVYRRAFARLAELLPASAKPKQQLPGSWLLRPLIDQFVKTLDDMASKAGETGWLEKTPKHFRHTRLILRFIPNAKVIHVVRQGPDVVASIYDRANLFPKQFGRQKNIDYAIKLWNRSVWAALRDVKRGKALVVMYEDFANHPTEILNGIGKHLNLRGRTEASGTPPKVINSAEHWKSGSSKTIQRARSKFTDTFDFDTRCMILKKLDTQAYESVVSFALPPSGRSLH